jgi:hypothetical protein
MQLICPYMTTVIVNHGVVMTGILGTWERISLSVGAIFLCIVLLVVETVYLNGEIN